MREIKFRAWHKFSEEIIPVFSIDFENQIINSKGPWRFFSEIELMQYTGLNDKNGIEIYEGDIVEADASGTMLGDTFFTGFQRYQRRKFVQDIRKIDFWNYTDKIEVIGNIYEHPHLLEEK